MPTAWRPTLKMIADTFVAGGIPSGEGIREIDPESARINAVNIQNYGKTLGPLTDRAWETSVYIWMRSYWQALVDLSTSDNERSDLVLHVKIYEVGSSFQFESGLIYVP